MLFAVKHRNQLRVLLGSTLATFAMLMTAPIACAHDFWLDAEKFKMDAPGNVDVAPRVGHTGDVSEWPYERRLVANVMSIGPDGSKSQLHASDFDDGQNTISAQLDTEGVHILVLNSMPSYSILPADKFNDYLEEEGIRPIMIHRSAKRLYDTPGRERYARRSKALIKVGQASGEQSHVTEPVGQSLEIVPLTDPYSANLGDTLPVQVLFFGEPVTGAKIHISRFHPVHDDLEPVTTNKDGIANIMLSENGEYLLHIAWSSPLPQNADQQADYDTLFAGLSFSWAATKTQSHNASNH